VARNEAGEDEATFDVHVLTAPKLADPGFRSVEARVGDPAELTCSILDPGTTTNTRFRDPVHFHWLREGQPLHHLHDRDHLLDQRDYQGGQRQMVHSGNVSTRLSYARVLVGDEGGLILIFFGNIIFLNNNSFKTL
jgi:hypothetical protein